MGQGLNVQRYGEDVVNTGLEPTYPFESMAMRFRYFGKGLCVLNRLLFSVKREPCNNECHSYRRRWAIFSSTSRRKRLECKIKVVCPVWAKFAGDLTVFCFHISERCQSLAKAIFAQACDGSNIELVHDLFAMRLDGLYADFQSRRNILGRVTVRDQLQDFKLSSGELHVDNIFPLSVARLRD